MEEAAASEVMSGVMPEVVLDVEVVKRGRGAVQLRPRRPTSQGLHYS